LWQNINNVKAVHSESEQLLLFQNKIIEIAGDNL